MTDIHPLSATNCTDFVVAHSNTILRPVRQLSEVSFLPHTLQVMRKLRLDRMLRVQSHTWRHLIIDRGHGAMVVAGPRSGRTFSYIPPVCDIAFRVIKEAHKADVGGPLIVILVPDLDRVRHVTGHCHEFLRILNQDRIYTPVLNVPTTKPPGFYHRLIHGVGCLVATPSQLVFVLENIDDIIQFENIKVIVYDDIDLMDPEMLARADKVLKKISSRILCHPQLMIVSQSYDPALMAKLKLLNSNPALIFGDILEAALYGETHLRIVLVPAQDKINEVRKMLQVRSPKYHRTVIFCVDDGEMRLLVKLLEEKHSYRCLPYYQDANLEVREQFHQWLSHTHGIILLITDNCPELKIRSAHTLIHYSMSNSWSKFKMRHLAISDNLNNKLHSDFSRRRNPIQLNSLVLLDETNQKQLPRLVDFAQRFQHVDDDIVAVAKQIRLQLARLTADQSIVCRQIMMLGDCINSSCEERHYADYMDQPIPSVPTSGDVKILLVRLYTPTHFCVHILEHLPPGKSWIAFPSLPVEDMRRQLMQGNINERYWPPVVGTICLCLIDGKKARVRVLRVTHIKSVNNADHNLKVLVQAMDEDTRIYSVKCGHLYKCPEELQAKPPMAIDLRLFGIVPYSGERDWASEDRQGIENTLMGLPGECFLQATVQFATAHTIFVRNMVAVSFAKNVKIHIRHFSLRKYLIENNLGKSCQQARDKILAFFEDVLRTILEMQEADQLKNDQEEMEVEEQEEQKVKVEEQKENTKENNSPNAPVFRMKFKDVLPMGLKHVRQRKEQEQKREQDKDEQLKQEEDKKADKQSQNNEGLKQLVQCVNNIAALQIEDAKTMPDQDNSQMLLAASKLLDHMENGAPDVNGKPKKSPKKQYTKSSDFKVNPPRDPRVQHKLPPNVKRPRTTYYQTLATLELQVELPDDKYRYTAVLVDNNVLFQAIHPSLDQCYQFQLPMGVPYMALKHYLRGRTIYMSVKKRMAMPDPLNYHHYRHFLKPNHEQFGHMDCHQEEQVEKFYKYGQNMKIKEIKYKEKEDEESAEEDCNMDGIERGDDNDRYED
ncbi:hypothetical protein KR200_003745 [Drosophila serrata]|nr:hypothetical protein KR200_003745 [Drosophila serrata]